MQIPIFPIRFPIIPIFFIIPFLTACNTTIRESEKSEIWSEKLEFACNWTLSESVCGKTWLQRNEDELGHIHVRAVGFSYLHTSAQLNINLRSRMKICTDFTLVSLHIVTVSTADHSLLDHLVWILDMYAIPETLTRNIVCITMWWIAAESYEYKLISLDEVQLNECCLIRIDLLEISAELCRIIFQIAHFPPFPWQSR